MDIILGVDVGGTSTDVVLLQGTTVLSSVKRFNTQDITTGVKMAIGEVFQRCSTMSLSIIARVHIGTTHLVNGVVERKGLAPVAVLRIGGCGQRLATDHPPFIDFPSELRRVVYGGHYHIQGGYELNGVEISPVDSEEVSTVVQKIKADGVRNIVVSGIFSPTNTDQEEYVQSLIQESYPEASITLSHTLGQLGLLNRENAGILNETLKPLCAKTIHGLCAAMKELNLNCPVFLTQNDGTVGAVDKALRFPVVIMASGPTNSMRGAAFLSSCKDALVIDIGGTTSDAGFIEKGFPRPSSATMKIAGVATNFEIPDVFNEGLGGGSKVVLEEDIAGDVSKITVGPGSVGHNLMSESIIYGGNVLTATDVAVAKGICQYGKIELLKNLNNNGMNSAYSKMKSILEDIIDRVKTGNEDVKLILVGGGSALFDEKDTFKGVSEVIKPDNCQVANAVGAALGQISGCVDKVVEMPERPINMNEAERETYDSKRKEAVDSAKQEAIDNAISAGAKPDTVEIISLNEVSLSYVPGNATRIIVKAVGDLNISAVGHDLSAELLSKEPEVGIYCSPLPIPSFYPDTMITNHVGDIEYNSRGEWILSPADIECMCIGAGILGCGGGGNPYLGKLKLLQSLRRGSSPKVIGPDADLDPGGLVLACAFMGAPLVTIERFSMSENELLEGFYALHDLYNNRGYCNGQLTETSDLEVKVSGGVTYIDNYILTEQGRKNMKENRSLSSDSIKFVCLMSLEIGGCNSTTPLLPASTLDLPVVDADAMGRAFPELQMTALNIYGTPSTAPHVLIGMSGQIHIVLKAESMKLVEDHLRPLCVAYGCSAALISAPICYKEVRSKSVVGTVTQAWEIGRALLGAAKAGFTPVHSLIKFTNATLIIEGKVSQVDRVTVGGFNRGSFTITGWKQEEGSKVVVDFQNEYLIAKKDGEVVGTTPDLLSLVDVESGYPVSTDELRYGLRVALLLIPAPPKLLTPEALAVVAPKAFGYPVEYISARK